MLAATSNMPSTNHKVAACSALGSDPGGKEKDAVIVLWARVKEDQVLVCLGDLKVLVPWVGCCLVVVPVLPLHCLHEQ